MHPRIPLAFFYHKHTLQAHAPDEHQEIQPPFLESWFPDSLLHVLVPGVVLPQLQDFVLPLVELHEVPVSPVLQHVDDPLDGSTTLWCIRGSRQFCVTSKFSDPSSRSLMI